MGANRFKHYRMLVPLLAFGWLAASPPVIAAQPAVDAQALGITASILAYCGRLDPAAATKIRARLKELENGASEQQLAAIRNSAEYRKAYDSMVEFVGQIDEHNAKRVCSESPAKS